MAYEEGNMNRETWLQQAVELIRPWFTEAGYKLPAVVHVSVGFPSKGALSRKVARLGECWKPQVSADGNSQIFINPTMADGLRVLDVLVHELIHAALPEAGHKHAFGKAKVALLLEGPNKATVATPELIVKLQALVATIGEYPHSALSPALNGEKKQTTRMIKVTCEQPQCKGEAPEGKEASGYTARLTRMWLDKFGPPLCPNCELQMIAEEKDGE